jgi:hypothetical protein
MGQVNRQAVQCQGTLCLFILISMTVRCVHFLSGNVRQDVDSGSGVMETSHFWGYGTESDLAQKLCSCNQLRKLRTSWFQRVCVFDKGLKIYDASPVRRGPETDGIGAIGVECRHCSS